MAGDVIYLDSDDEITSAAARIRAVEGRRAAVVLPYGSRVATSRINFRLLARDALTHEKRLSIIAADAAARALAASAGLPVFGSVAEYEEAMSAERAERGGGAAAGGADAADPARAGASPLERSETIVTGSAAGAATVGTAGQAAPDSAGVRSTGRARRPRPAATIPLELDGGAATADLTTAGAAPDGRAAPEAESGARTAPRATPARPLPQPEIGAIGPRPAMAGAAVHAGPAPRSTGRAVGRTPILVGLAALALVALVAGVGAYLFLPSATAVVIPRQETIGPISLRIVASTDVTAPDVEAGIVPAEAIEVPVDATDAFPATGTRVEESKATGTVRFRNKDFTARETIPKGAVVSTGSGVRFRTDAAVTVPAAELVGLQVFPATATVKVTAVDAGPDGNVEPNTILTIPRGEDPLTLDVTNPEATSGGAREEFPRVTQEDVDAAMAAITTALEATFRDRLDDDGLVSGDVTVFAETGQLGLMVPTVDPDTLVGQEVESFDLGATATGTVIAVDAAPVRAIAEARLQASVEAGHELVDGSSEITEAPAVVEGGTIAYPVVVTARQVAILDPAALEAEILGTSLDEARAALSAYGDVELEVWPDWVGTIPTLDARVEVTVQGPISIDEPSSEPSS